MLGARVKGREPVRQGNRIYNADTRVPTNRHCHENRLFSSFIRGLGRPSVILAAAGIQSPFPHPNTWDNAGVVPTGLVSLAERRGVMRIPTKSFEIKGSGFPLRRE